MGNVLAQTTLSGTLTDSTTTAPLPFAAVTLAEQAKPDIPAAYTYTNDAGEYTLTVPKATGAYVLTAYTIGYAKTTRLIYFDEASPTRLRVDFSLAPTNTELATAVVTTAAPILVRGDTTIYDIEHFTEARDVTLEDVLDRIPGMKILPDGNIRVDGRTVDKVLLEGKELSGGGAALLTRGISAKDVAKVEVRFDEQDEKLRESLLESRDLVVLDIQLKGTVNQDFFGRAALTAGYGDVPGLAPGGNANVFSLSPKLNLQGFAESDRFGDQLISLRDLDNIGREAYAAQFELPADFTALTQREGYSSELYGFADYIRKDYHVVGLSGQLDLDSVTTLYAGTFNAYDEVHQASANTQRFVEGPVLRFAEAARNGQFGSKNKLELKTTTNKLRWNTDLNAVYTQGRQRNEFRFDTSTDRFRDRFREFDLYANSLLEFRPRARTGLKLRLGFADERQRSDVNTQLGSESFREAYAEVLDRDVASVTQERDVRVRSANAELGSQLLSPIGPLSPGVRYQYRWLFAEKMGRGGEGTPTLSSLTLSDTTVSTTQVTPHVAYAFELGGWSANVDVGYAIARYPVPAARETRTKQAWEVNAFVDGSLWGVSLNGTYTQSLSAFPLYQTLPALDIVGLQALASPGGSTLEPQLQSVISGAADFEFGKTQITSAVLVGRTRQSGRFDPAFAPLTVQRYDQLEAGYLLVSNIIDWRPTGWPVRFIFEPEWVTNTQEVRAPGEPSGYTILSRRTLIGVKAQNPVGGKFKYFAYAKYSNFNFLLRDTKTDLGRLEFLSFQLSPKLDFGKGWLQVDPRARLVQFLGSAASTNLLVDLELAHRDEKLDFGLTISNLLDNDSFRQNTLSSLVFSEQETRIFNRAARASVRFKF